MFVKEIVSSVGWNEKAANFKIARCISPMGDLATVKKAVWGVPDLWTGETDMLAFPDVIVRPDGDFRFSKLAAVIFIAAFQRIDPAADRHVSSGILMKHRNISGKRRHPARNSCGAKSERQSGWLQWHLDIP